MSMLVRNPFARKVYSVLLATAVAAMPVLAGCPLMMPIMMAPMAYKATHNSESDHRRFINAALVELAANRNGYQTIELGQIETDGNALPIDAFRKTIIDQMRSSGIRVPEGEHPSHSPGADLSDEGAEASAILDAQLMRVESRDRLDFSLKDARTGRVVWEKRFSASQRPSSPGHAQRSDDGSE